VIQAKGKWYRFRVNNASVARPYLLLFVDSNNVEISANLNCQVIAGDGKAFEVSLLPTADFTEWD
jgi:hypothetical protein